MVSESNYWLILLSDFIRLMAILFCAIWFGRRVTRFERALDTLDQTVFYLKQDRF
jgi:hypothetical protein